MIFDPWLEIGVPRDHYFAIAPRMYANKYRN